MVKQQEFDVVIVGGGPAGTTAALYANRLGLSTLIVDKSIWPRDKICGDALSGKVVDILNDLDIISEVKTLKGASIRRIRFGSPANKIFDIDLTKSFNTDHIKEAYVIPREIFDYFLFKKARKITEVKEGFTVKDLLIENDTVVGIRGTNKDGNTEDISATVVLGADGYNSIVAQKLNLYKMEMEHTAFAIRSYYEGVKGLTDQIELHYLEEINPGYFWLFPIGEGKANIGLGLSKRNIKEQKKNLIDLLDIVTQLEYFKDRFSHAKQIGKPKGWNLPMGSMHRKNHGNGFMLLGDAAGLIDPFTGEGIGNAMVSGKHAITIASKAINENDLSENNLSEYDKILWGEIGPELSVSTKLQKVARSKFLLNFVMNRAARNDGIKDIIGGMMANEIPRSDLANPAFYFKIFFS